jgi:hypothetical protein
MSNQFAKCCFALLTAIGLVFTVSYATAQSNVSGSISGTVTDATGAVITGATVTITNMDRGEDIRVLITNSAGFFTAEALPLGTYKVTIAGAHFKTEVVTGLVLHAADALTVNQVLTPGGANEIVTVTAGSAQVDLEDATSAGLINSTQMNEMPLITRNYETLINLQPGVAFSGATDDLTRGPAGLSGSSSTVAFSVNGGRTTSNSWTLDGADNLDRGANLTLYNYPSPDAIAEFKTLRGQYSAAFGRNASGQIDVVTKSGTNDIHGSAYEYLRNDYFDANGYANDFLGAHIAPYRYNVFGFSAGAPVIIPKIYNGHNKTFFFVSEEWQRIVQVLSQATATVPLSTELGGDFTQSYQYVSNAWTQAPVTVCTGYTTNTTTQVNSCTGTGTKVTTISPTAQAYLKDVFAKAPSPNPSYDIAHGFDPHTIFTNFKDVFNNLDSLVRVDQQFGQRLSVFYRYMHDTFPETLLQGLFSGQTVYIAGATPTSVINPGTQHLAHVTYVINPTLLLNVGYSFSNGNIVATPTGFLSSSQSPDINPTLPFANTVGIVPYLSISGMTSLTSTINYTDHGTDHQAYGDLTKTLHTHTLIFGFSYNHYQKLENNTGGNQGSFSFANDSQYYCSSKVPPPCIPTPASGDSGTTESQAIANFLTGNANGGFSQLSNDPVTDMKFALYEGFAQDNWKVQPRLTLNLGVRYGYYGQPWDAKGQLSNFLPSSYSASKAPTIATTGLMCFTGTCSQTGSNAGLSASPNPNADFNSINYINGMIFNGPAAANNSQGSPYGNKVGTAQKTNFAPRIGFAYDLFGNGQTVVRGGYGWSFDNAEVSYYETTVFNNPPTVATYSATQTSFDNPSGGLPLSTTPGRIQAVPLNFQTPYVQQFSLDVQQILSPSFMFDLGYFGDHGTHLLGGEELNQPAPGAWVGVVQPSNSGSACIDPDTNAQSFFSTTCDRVLNQIRPYLGYNPIDTLRTIFNSNYNSLQAKVTKRFKGKTFVDANYTWSRDLTNAQNDYSTFVQNIYNINGDYGRAAVDRKQVLNLDWVLEEPWFREQKDLTGRILGGWELSGIYAVDAGLPLTATASAGYSPSYNLPSGATSVYNSRTSTGYITDNAGIGVLGTTSAGLRVNMIGNPNAGNGVPIHNKGYHQLWFYTGAFAAPSASSAVPATEKRGTIQGPGFQRLDLGIYRNFRIWERLSFQFRMEALNAANHTNVQTISTAAGSASTFGEVTGYRDARIMQFAGKFTF